MEDKPSSFVREALPFAAMVAVETVGLGLVALSKAAMTEGLSQYVFIVYYDALSVVILLPWFLHRCLSGKTLPVTFSLLCRLFGLALIGKCGFPICYYTGLGLSSITVATAISNMSSVLTYLLAVCFRMEKPDLRRFPDQLKASGTVVAVLGALVVTFYRGPVLLKTLENPNSSEILSTLQLSNWTLGVLILTLSVLLKSTWNILQTSTVKSYPDEVSIIFFYNGFGTVQTAVASFFLVEDASSWKVTRKFEIVAIVYANLIKCRPAFAMSAFTLVVVTWCLKKKGPVYVNMFSPLCLAMSVVVGFVFLAEDVYLGSIIGSAAIVAGFYAVMWAQAKTTHVAVDSIGDSERGSNPVTPLLGSSRNRS